MSKSVEQQRIHFEGISQVYYKARQDSNHLLYKKLMWEYFFLINPYFSDNNYKCLEPMCGYGEGNLILKNYSKLNFSYCGFDYSSELVNIANEINVDFAIEYGNVLDFNNGKKYNLIILIGGLHHVYKDVNRAIVNLNRMVDLGAYFISFEPTHNNIIFKKIRNKIYKENILFDNQTERAFNLLELNRLFINNGYVIVEQIYPGLLGYVLYYNPDAFKWLNIGNNKVVKFIFNIEKFFFKNFVGRYFSFATLTVWKKIE